MLKKKIIIRGKIKALTGLHIGGSNTALSIGGVDVFVVRNPLTNKPYIPGSSIKGKMRCLLEQLDGISEEKNPRQGQHIKYGPSKKGKIAHIFGNSDNDDPVPSKIIVRDGDLLDEKQEILKNKFTDLPYTEAKTEVVIDRKTAKATPRTIERVPAGAEFSLNIVVNVLEGDNEQENLRIIFNGLRLIQDDYLGGKGSRGCGQVQFYIESIKERSKEFYLDTAPEKDYTEVPIPADLKA
ncbi:MAG: type III-A CRISPR-associated RAMP protein Csm3 [Bacteroidia bacterium]|nr:type III-A CRISPR-associated RAMP protein Csm3 [Bacteroidia bacterium]MDW8301473.1 type III-A CRISPR-associated RAMP protein Csm3 [Bacteroidia bacterium]